LHNPDCCYQQAFDFSVFLLVQETREEVERLKEQVAEFKEAYGQDFDEQIKNLAVEYEQTTDGNAEAYNYQC
jgi:archaellum component FlaC